jgi:MFS family permease
MPTAERTASGVASGLAEPLRVKAFRHLWAANLASNFGSLIQNVGAAWLMTSLVSSADMVALVQTATLVPILLFAIVAGAIADLRDRRRVLLVAQVWMFAVAAILALAAWRDWVGPWTLLAFTFLLGIGGAVNGPTFQAVVRELVPPHTLAAAVTVNSISFNLARSLGPALGGLIVALAGPEAAFLVNALTYLPLIAALAAWKRPRPAEELPGERLSEAVVNGLRYVRETRVIRAVMTRSAIFGFAATATLALLPVVARNEVTGGPLTFGFLLGAFGAGALIGAFAMQPLRRRVSPELIVAGLTALAALSLLGVAQLRSVPLLSVALALGGAAWLGSLSSFNIMVQQSTASWVQARVLAIYQTVLFGAMAAGAYAWGHLAEASSVRTALATAALVMAASLALAGWLRLPSGPAPDLSPRRPATEPVTALAIEGDHHDVIVTIEYRVPLTNAAAFARAMDEIGHMRRRDGAARWQLLQDVAEPALWQESFSVSSWMSYLRQRRRGTAADQALIDRARALTDPAAPPLVRRFVARDLASRLG